MSRRTLAFGALVVAMLVVLAIAGGPSDADPIHAFVRFLDASGVDVRRGPTPPEPPGTFLLLADARSPAQARSLLGWASRGGRLVVADPASSVATLLGAGVGERAGFIGPTPLAPGCADPLAVGVVDLVVDAADRTLSVSTPGAVSCFARPGGSYAAVFERGAGSVVLLGGSSFLTNDLLADGDNGVAALRLVGDGPVVLGPPLAPGAAAPSEWQLMSGAARALVVGVIVAAVAFALARARRMGRPVEEPVPAPIPASALVEATAGLYRRARAAPYCGRLVRASARARLARGVGMSPDADVETLAADVARTSGLSRARVRSALAGPEPAGDAELLRLVAELSDIGARTRGGSAAAGDRARTSRRGEPE